MATISSESRLDATWRALREARRTALIPYITAGYPNRAASLELLRAAARSSDIIEVGVPFSDPLADGPTIQRSSFEALKQGMTLAGTLDLIREAAVPVPIVVFSYLNPVRRYGLTRFLGDAASAGASGLLLTDLPAGADLAFEAEVRASSLDLIRLLAPTTRDARLAAAVDGAAGFLYLVARLGVTGASASLATGLDEYIARVRAATPLPLAVGFGISNAQQATDVAHMADGVVVGSALVDIVGAQGVDAADAFLRSLRAALDAAPAGP